jgi:hypothetical protein
MGTVGYMSPEQVAGTPADHRSDLFSFGVILYEMLTGARAFGGQSAMERAAAILRDEPPPIVAASSKELSPALDRIVRHCLEKKPERRFQSARDLMFALEAITMLSGVSVALPSTRSSRRWWIVPVAIGAVAAAFALGMIARGGQRSAAHDPPRADPPPAQAPPAQAPLHFTRATYTHELIEHARFMPDGKSFVFTIGRRTNDQDQSFIGRLGSPEAQPIGIRGAVVFAVASDGELLIGRDLVRLSGSNDNRYGTLARVRSGGVTPRDIAKDVASADLSRDGKTVAAIVHDGDGDRLELPLGHPIYRSKGYLQEVRIAPAGDRVAVIDHPILDDDMGSAVVLDSSGKELARSPNFSSMIGLAWGTGDELWLGASVRSATRDLFTWDLHAAPRLAASGTTSMLVTDVAPDGRLLVADMTLARELRGHGPGEQTDHDLSLYSMYTPVNLTRDGTMLSIEESDEQGAFDYHAYLRPTDGKPAVYLGEGRFPSVSPDGKLVAASSIVDLKKITILPTGAGTARDLEAGPLTSRWSPQWLDGAVVYFGTEPGHESRLYVQDLVGGAPRAISPEGVSARNQLLLASPDGKTVVANLADHTLALIPVDGGAPRPIKGIEPDDLPAGFTSDGRSLFVSPKPGSLRPPTIVKVDLASGRRDPWKTIELGGAGLSTVLVGADGAALVYSSYAFSGELYVAER